MRTAILGTECIDLDSYKDRTGTIDVNGLSIGVVIKDARIRYGHLDFLVTPILGTGEKWMENHKVTTLSTEKPSINLWPTTYPEYQG